MKKRKAKTRYYTEYTRPESYQVWRQDYRGRVTYSGRDHSKDEACEWHSCSYTELPSPGMHEIGVVKAKKILGLKRINDR